MSNGVTSNVIKINLSLVQKPKISPLNEIRLI